MSTVVKLKPTTPGQRGTVRVKQPGLHKGKPHKSLLTKKIQRAGRNSAGRITVRHRGGGHKRFIRIVDFKRNKFDVPGTVKHIEYDPNRSANLALISYADGEYRYIIAPKNLKVGAKVLSGEKSPIAIGNCLPLTNIPVGSTIHCIEMRPKKGAQIARSAGTSAMLLGRDASFATIRLKSGEVRRVHVNCSAVIGEVGNENHSLRCLGKAGAKRWRGIRPTVRGVAMNPVDHPMGGGEGRTSGGRHPCDPWGRINGTKTRKKKHRTQKYIVRARERNKG